MAYFGRSLPLAVFSPKTAGMAGRPILQGLHVPPRPAKLGTLPMLRGVKNLIFRSGAPPIFAAISLAMFILAMIAFWRWQRFIFTYHLPPYPCGPADTVVHFRSRAFCATAAQSAYWAREGHIWKALFVMSFAVHWSGVVYKRLTAPHRAV
jgi:hypothetical protein